jgi:DNA invertase Pin-like site-specific DNA recombinase
MSAVRDDVPIRKGWKRLTRDDIASMRKEYAAGVPIAKIARAHGVDWSTVWRRLKKN